MSVKHQLETVRPVVDERVVVVHQRTKDVQELVTAQLLFVRTRTQTAPVKTKMTNVMTNFNINIGKCRPKSVVFK